MKPGEKPSEAKTRAWQGKTTRRASHGVTHDFHRHLHGPGGGKKCTRVRPLCLLWRQVGSWGQPSPNVRITSVELAKPTVCHDLQHMGARLEKTEEVDGHSAQGTAHEEGDIDAIRGRTRPKGAEGQARNTAVEHGDVTQQGLNSRQRQEGTTRLEGAAG